MYNLLPAEWKLTNWKGNFNAVTSVGFVSAKLTISMRYVSSICKNSSFNFSNCGDSEMSKVNDESFTHYVIDNLMNYLRAILEPQLSAIPTFVSSVLERLRENLDEEYYKIR